MSLAIRLLRLSLLVGLILLGFLACQGRPDGESGGGVADSGNGSAETDTTNGANEGAPGPSPERAAQPEEPAKPTVSRFVPLAEVEIEGLPFAVARHPGGGALVPGADDGMAVSALALRDGEVYAWYVAGETVPVEEVLPILDGLTGVDGGQAGASASEPAGAGGESYMGTIVAEAAARLSSRPEFALLVPEGSGVYQLRVVSGDRWLVLRIYFDERRQIVDIEWFETAPS